jgi:YegS/Rv2252/BmrU family lipid kinase
MTQGSHCFIVNPAAGGGFAGRNWPILRETLCRAGIDHRHYLSEHNGHCRELARAALEAGQRKFVVVGGDGTANEVLNGLIDASGADAAAFSLGVVPWGTGNDWASYYGFSRQAEDFIQVLLAGCVTRQDIGRATFTDESGATREHYFLNCAGTGFDSYLLRKMGSGHGSRIRYFLFLFKCLRKFRATSMQLDLDTASFEGPTLLLEICLGKFAGAGMHFAPTAAVDDGLFDVLHIEDLGITQLLGSLSYLYNGRINEHRAARHWRCRSVSISARDGQALHCDGELIAELPVQIELLPRALSVLTPGDPPRAT